MHTSIFSILIFVCFSLTSCKEKTNDSISDNNQTVEVYNFSQLEPLLHVDDNNTYVINFWATWCKPCVKELPIFQEVHDNYVSKNVKVLLISLDFPEKIETQLKPFIKKHSVTPKVILLDDPHENIWIPKVDKSWSGALPATLIYNKEKRAFYEQSFTKESLLKELKKFTKL